MPSGRRSSGRASDSRRRGQAHGRRAAHAPRCRCPSPRPERFEIGDRRFEPGMRSGRIAGSACPARRTTLDSGSARSGSRSSKLAMRGSRGTAILIRAAGLRAVGARPRTSSAGSRARLGEIRARRREQRQPVRSPIVRDAVVEEREVAAELVDDEAAITRGAPPARARCVPTSGAITPPRSMSPTSMTGTSARFGKTHIGDVAGAKIDFRRRPRPLHDHEIGVASQPARNFQHGGQQLGFQRLVVARLERAPSALPCTMTCAPVSVSRLQQHRVHVHATARHARRAPAATARGRSRRRRPSPRHCSTCSAA